MKIKLLLLLIIATNIVLGQDGTKDTSFSATQGVDNIIYATAVQSDGKILIAGDFTLFGVFSVNRLARLNADGTLDTSFTPFPLTGSVRAIAIQSDGKILVGGNFGPGILRLNSNGTNDSSFAPGVGVSSSFVVAIAVQPDGKIIIGGTFQTYQNSTANRIQRLNSDGSRDTSFDAGNGPSAAVRAIAVRPDGRLIIGGDFSNYGSFIASRLAIIESDGGFNSALNTNSGFNSGSSVFDIELLPDGKFVAVGAFTSHTNATNATTTVNRIALFDAQGNLDSGFNPALGGANAFVNSIAKTADNKYIIGGLFSSYNGTSRLRVAKLNADLTLDTSFNPGTGVNNEVNSVSIQSDGKVILGGAFTSYNGGSVVRVVRLNNTVNVPSQCPAAGDVILTSQSQVDDFAAAYPNCTTIDGNLIINGATITDITGLNQITTINGALSILNTGITNGAIFNNLTQVTGQLNIQSNNNLTTLTGFNALVNAGETLQILNNQNITSITGFSNLVTVAGNLSILSTTGTLATTNISGFSNVQSVGYLLIRRMPLTNLSQLSSLNTILRGLSIDTNPNLTSIASLSSVTNAVNGNGTTPFRIFANPLLESLNGINFSSVTNCLDVQISQLPLVTSLQPLSVINGQIGGLIIQNNPALLNLNGLEGITNVNGSVAISSNAALLNLNGLQNITNITSGLGIVSNGLITQLPNWNLRQVRSINLSNNVQLASISSLSGITSLSAPISGLPTALSISSCQALTSLNGLQNLTTLNNANINLTGNNNLIDISALNGLNVNSINGLTIVSNTSLSACGVLWVCGRLALNTDNVTFSNNASGCESFATIQLACAALSTTDFELESSLKIYPNPFNNQISIALGGDYQNVKTTLVDVTGKQFYSKTFTGNTIEINQLDALSSGIYFVKIELENGTSITKKIVK